MRHAGSDHCDGSDSITSEQQTARPAADDSAEEQRSGDAAQQRARGVEERNGRCADLLREELAGAEIGGAGAGGRDEEDSHPACDLRGCAEAAEPKETSGERQQQSGKDEGAAGHGSSADGVKEPPQQQGTQKIGQRNGQEGIADAAGGCSVVPHQDESEGEKDRVVEESLRRHQGHGDEGALAVRATQQPERFQQTCSSPELRGIDTGREHNWATLFDGAQYLRRLVSASVGQQPARTLRHAAAQHEHEQADGQPGEKSDTPAKRHGKDAAGEKCTRDQRSNHDADPEGAVDGEIDSSAQPRWNQFIDCGVHSGILAADPGARQEAADGEAGEAPRRTRCGGGAEVSDQCPEEDLPPAVAVRKQAEHDGAKHRTGEVDRGTEA